ncbi:MAG: dTDP-4-amino-4,6-dideoxygalactose transaminase [Bacteroidetes bacterium]|nr:dTDP-4-amino-4,6-dideoxygalactose transaminase [Bacteroidota bacterium]
MAYTVQFNKPFIVGKELEYIREAVALGKLTGDGHFTRLCHQYFQERYGFAKCLLTTSCTDALEMSALLARINPGDEVIVPSYTFVSTANAFVLRGANIVFADSLPDQPNLDVRQLEALITPRTKAIVPVHYAGVAVDMDPLMALARQHQLLVVEDAAQAIESRYKGKQLGSIGHFAAFSFHETKNIISGEGGMLVVNDPSGTDRAEILWEKGTNRAAFFRGETDKYNWVDIGSSFLPSELTAAFLYAQLEHLEQIQAKRLAIWKTYFEGLRDLEQQGRVALPRIPDYASNNAHMFYLVAESLEQRTALIDALKADGYRAVFHYQALHESPFYRNRHDGRALPEAMRYSDCLVRLPMYYELDLSTVQQIAACVRKFYNA